MIYQLLVRTVNRVGNASDVQLTVLSFQNSPAADKAYDSLVDVETKKKLKSEYIVEIVTKLY